MATASAIMLHLPTHNIRGRRASAAGRADFRNIFTVVLRNIISLTITLLLCNAVVCVCDWRLSWCPNKE